MSKTAEKRKRAETDQSSDMSTVFKLLSDPTRLKILGLLFSSPGKCVSDISEKVGISHSATSHQLSKLEIHGVVACQRNGQTMCYKIKKTTKTTLIKNLLKKFK